MYIYEKLKYNQVSKVSKACRNHWLLISSNSGIKKFLQYTTPCFHQTVFCLK